MALVPCKDCGQLISDECFVCPNCGRKYEFGPAGITPYRKRLTLGALLMSIGAGGFMFVLLSSGLQDSPIRTPLASSSFITGVIGIFMMVTASKSNETEGEGEDEKPI